jgi:hypothetical protein
MSAVHFEPMISAVQATAHSDVCTSCIVRVLIASSVLLGPACRR